MNIPQEKVTADLAPHLPALYKAVSAAIDKYHSLPASVRLELNLGASASMVHCFFFAGIHRYVENRHDAWTHDEKGLSLFVTDEGYALRFKKVGEDLVPRGAHTKQVKRFRRQEEFPGFPQSVHLDLAYQLDDLGKLQSVRLLCPSGDKRNMWEVEIVDDGVDPVVVNLFDPVKPSPEFSGGKFVPKPKKNDETQSGNGDPSA